MTLVQTGVVYETQHSYLFDVVDFRLNTTPGARGQGSERGERPFARQGQIAAHEQVIRDRNKSQVYR